MQYNDTTTKLGLIQRCEFLTEIGDAGISGNTTLKAQFTSLLNTYYDRAVLVILRSQDAWDFDDKNNTDFPILTTNLVASQQDYQLPAPAIEIKRAEITYDGINWYKLIPFDVNESSEALSTATIAQNFATTTPYYDLQYGSLFLYPIPSSSVTGGLKLYTTRNVTQFTASDTTKEPGIDRLFHDYLAIGASYDWCKVKGKKQANSLAADLLKLEAEMKVYYGKKDKDRQYVLKSNYQSYE
jgi:hypothetical protein